MALTGPEIASVATRVAVTALIAGVVLIVTRPDSGPAVEGIQGTPGQPTATPGAPGTATPDTPGVTTGTVVTAEPTVPPVTVPPVVPVVPTAVPTAAPTRSLAPLAPTTAPPRTTAPPVTRPPATTAAPTSAPATPRGRISLISDLPEECEDALAACRYPDAPAGSRVAAAPVVRATLIEPGRERVVVTSGGGASPAGVGFVVLVRGVAPSDYTAQSRGPYAREFFDVLVPTGIKVIVSAQELNEAGLSQGRAVSVDQPAS